MTSLSHFRQWLEHPFKVLIASCICAVFFLLYDGSFWNLWSLHRNEKEMVKRIHAIQDDIQSLNFKVEQSRQHSFIERQATDQLGLVREDDLVFVFSDSE